jgi:hypothetical protein
MILVVCMRETIRKVDSVDDILLMILSFVGGKPIVKWIWRAGSFDRQNLPSFY